MEIFEEYIANINNIQHRTRVSELLSWITKEFQGLIPVIKWSQPMFTQHGTFIIAFNVAKNYLSVSPEKAALSHFSEEIKQNGYECSKELIRIKWDDPINYSFLANMIEFNISDKAECSTFWRK